MDATNEAEKEVKSHANAHQLKAHQPKAHQPSLDAKFAMNGESLHGTSLETNIGTSEIKSTPTTSSSNASPKASPKETIITTNAITISELTPELILRAEKEVNEKEAWRDRDIQALREIVENENLLNSQSDDLFLLKFLRARRFDYDGALQLIKHYYYLQANNPELFVAPNRLKCVFDAKVMTLLPKKTNAGEAIFVFEAGRWNPRSYNFDTLIAGSVICMETAALDQVTQITGLVCVIDMTDFGWTHLRRFGPMQAKKIVHIIDECLPIRFKAIHIIHESTLADIAFAILRPFLSEELRNKIVFHGSNLSDLHTLISPEILPSEIGGRQGPLNCHTWFQEIIEKEEYLISCWENYGFKKEGALNDFVNENTIEGNLFRKSQTCNGYLFDYYKPSRTE